MHHLGYKSCLVDPDLWYKPDMREEDKHKYYSCVLLYVVCIPHSAEDKRIDRGPRYLPWSQGQANENEQWCDSMGNQPKQVCQ